MQPLSRNGVLSKNRGYKIAVIGLFVSCSLKVFPEGQGENRAFEIIPLDFIFSFYYHRL
jgi:hypothetical protein